MFAAEGIQPIIGLALKVDFAAPPPPNAPKPHGAPQKCPCLVFLAKDEPGYRNLIKLSIRAYLDAPDTAEPTEAQVYDPTVSADCSAGDPGRSAGSGTRGTDGYGSYSWGPGKG